MLSETFEEFTLVFLITERSCRMNVNSSSVNLKVKRNDREALRLAEALKIVNDIQNKIPECKELAE